MNQPTLDDTDLRIIELLLENALRSHKEIGEQVHLTSQAVGARVRKLQDMQVIEGYTLRWRPEKLGLAVHAFIVFFMNLHQSHHSFRSYVQSRQEVQEMHRVSGEGCYWLRVRVTDMAELNRLLDDLLRFGNYKLSLSTEQLK
ncbi:Lrp/AsnC family transcriptional regulator, leucine-responsive regulatory protein [Paenibacillus sp. NFR01]|nr:Lrp/AsnC family transcriptional regulator, leucine-responsive regulatory protein [Paenibacillus sp. NFR01]